MHLQACGSRQNIPTDITGIIIVDRQSGGKSSGCWSLHCLAFTEFFMNSQSLDSFEDQITLRTLQN